MLRLQLSLGGMGTPANTRTTTPPPAGLYVLHLLATHHQGTERGHQPGKPGQEGLAQVHHPIGKGPTSGIATTTLGKGTTGTAEMR